MPSSTHVSMQTGTGRISSNRVLLPTASGAGGGTIPCSRFGCSYKCHTDKDLELHLMDRHFIHPTGNNPRKRKTDDGRGPDGDAATYGEVRSHSVLCNFDRAFDS